MLIFFGFIVICLFLVSCFFFLSKKASPIPYFPSNKQDIPHILKALNLHDDQTLIDLGAGDGIVVFSAAQNTPQSTFVAVEINPILIAILYVRRLFHPQRNNIVITRGDLFSMHFHYKNPIFFMYISPWLLEKAVKNIKKQFPNSPIVTYFYPLSGRKPSCVFVGINPVYLYT